MEQDQAKTSMDWAEIALKEIQTKTTALDSNDTWKRVIASVFERALSSDAKSAIRDKREKAENKEMDKRDVRRYIRQQLETNGHPLSLEINALTVAGLQGWLIHLLNQADQLENELDKFKK